ncbi:HipA domain-containing protein [Flagellimonas halotolerans]|uniref:HipA domain-containing protein n=1 Tax=Flagellimonas halotolerans TaxID=3112164 RepID=A0ABU6IR64_9FLAO|nr:MULTISPECIES: HipA domain-containing protein [unclassified Allomuricauda]MEC3965725.1 HipA domain-containing protein [Muricauda sp. SYSU M86414]MEC4265592.1 HipA domain-containing protein [Muricauda sp. SYSU M84420]
MITAKLTGLHDLPYTASELRREAVNRAKKLSIQGVQPKLSASISVVDQEFKVVDQFGTYIIKPQNDIFPQLPENEDLTMRMAKVIGINVPFHGMVYGKDGSLSYFIKRFDRYGKGKKYATEGFAQLTGNARDTKYRFCMEKLVPVIEEFCTFPVVEKLEFFKRIVYCFVTGNEDMHLKKFSLITKNGKTTLAPAYDLLNSSIAINNPEEEIALTLKGKKSNLKASDFTDYYAKERLQLNEKTIETILQDMFRAKQKWKDLISVSFLSNDMKEKYSKILEHRLKMFQ